VTARLTGVPWYEEGGRRVLHLGAAVSLRDPDDTVRYNPRPEAHLSTVHFIATRFMPAYSAYADLGGMPVPEPYMRSVPPKGSVYISGRNIGDEYRYILERKYARKFPGNTLDRPGLLINPWAIRKTETEQQLARPGEAPRASAEPEQAMGERMRAPAAPAIGGIDFANLDFLSGDAVVLANLRPDENGVVTVERDALGGRQHLHVVAVDPVNTVYRQVALKEDPIPFQDLRLARGLDPDSHATQQKQITFLRAGDTLVIEDMTSSRIEAYDTIAKVFRLFTTLSKDATLAEFEFVTRWPELSEEEKRAKYSKYASHELNFFLSRKDPEFFSAAVQPYTRNKMHKTFLDRWLVEDDLNSYFDPWAHAQLNIVEKILLAERVAGERTPTARFVADQFNLLPPNIDLFNRLFLTGIQGSALEFRGGVGGAFDLRAGLERFDYADDADMQAINGRLRGAGLAMHAPMREEAARQIAASKAVARGAVADEISLMSKDKSREVIGGRKKESVSNLAFAARDVERREQMRQFYQKLDKTREWVENNYYHLPIGVQNADLITVNAFWRDFATRNPNEAFISTNVAESSRNFAEMMLALAVIDLPFTAGEHETQLEEDRYTVTAASPMIVFHEEIREAGETDDTAPVLVSQNFFRQDDRYRYVENEPVDNFITGEFLVNVVYGCQVTVTNPGSGRQKLDVLLQVPRGSLPSLNGKYTRSISLTLEPYSTQAIVYHFYFPKEGDFLHYPVHVSRNGRLIANVDPQPMHVLLTPSSVDTASWDYISQNGNEQDVVNFLNANNINRTNLDRIAWRMRDRDFFGTIRELLRARHAYNNTLWGYAVMHNDVDAMREFLQHQDGFVAQCGAYIDAPLLTIDPVIRKSYQHMEYKPLVNARAHRLGPQRKILNDRFREQYARLMNVLSYRPLLNGDDLMSVTQYMLTQDRIEEALDFFGKVRPGALNARIQYDYFDAYLAFYNEDLARAREIVERYTDHPVDRWKNLFAAAANQLEEIDGAQTRVADAESRGQRQDLLAAGETNFDFSVESRKVDISYQNATRATINYYVMDLELLFSRNPFVKEYSDHFLTVYPNLTEHLTLDPDSGEHTIDLPDQLQNSNVMIEIEMGGVKKSEAYYAHSLTTQVIENYGQVVVTHGETGAPLSKVYVKVFARMQDGDVRFYKDGYTDLRGRFDYTSLNTNELDFVQEFSMLIMSETDGAVVREARPPKR